MLTIFKCRFAKECEYYRKPSHTCRTGGSSYCGVYRKFEKEEQLEGEIRNVC